MGTRSAAIMLRVSTDRPTPDAFSPAAGLRALAGLAAVGLGLSALALTTGWGIPCPWRTLTGTLCPFCGGTTLGVALLRGDLATAWAANPLVLTGLLLLTVLGALWSLELAGGPAVRLPRRLRLGATGWTVFVGLVAAGFAVWRNLAG